MKLQLGKRYVRRDGQISGVIEHNPFNHEYPYVDDKYHNTYTEKGKRFNNLWDHDSDLASVHYESEPNFPIITDPSMMVISVKEYDRLKEIESHLKQVTELWNEIQAEKL